MYLQGENPFVCVCIYKMLKNIEIDAKLCANCVPFILASCTAFCVHLSSGNPGSIMDSAVLPPKFNYKTAHGAVQGISRAC